MSESKVQIPTEFKKIIVDMTKDILVSFPEQEQNLHKELKNLVFEVDKDRLDHSLKYIYIHCKTFYPVKFFDILYQNSVMFENEECDCEFLPGIKFKALWKENISDKTRETIWKYLQLVLFTIVSSISDGDTFGNTFGDTAKLFEAINENEFKSKLEETISHMQDLFGEDKNKNTENTENTGNTGNTENTDNKEHINLDDLPDPTEIHEHVTNMMNGKLGKLAREIAEETAADLNINSENAESVNDVFKKLIKNPTKLLSLVKNVGSKLDEKIKSGDMKESELLEEASELIKQMKNMPGMGNLQSMFSKMGMNMGKPTGNSKVNVDAMQTNINQRLKDAKNRERLLKNLNERKAAAAAATGSASNSNHSQTQPIENLVFSTGEHIERSSRNETSQTSQSIKKKKKNKQ